MILPRYERYNPDDETHKVAIARAAVYSHFAPMLPLNRARIESFDYSLLALSGDRSVFLGHVAVQKRAEQPALLSGLLTNPLFPRQRIGDGLMEFAATDIPQALPEVQALQAFANDDSRKLFTRHGGVVVGRRPEPVPTGCVHIVDLTPMLQTGAA